jgi:FKBP-type peptidyl-prolyl cis-trans isomerase 2
MKEGDFIRIDFLGRVAGTGEIFDFTQESVAREKGLHNATHTYGPAFVIVGAKFVIPGVEKQLLKMRPGEERRFSVPPEEGFGPRNPKLVKVFPIQAFLKEKINPVPGSFVDIEGMRGKVQTVSGGRVRVDFNHPLAGKKLNYWVKITEVIRDTREKVNTLFSYYRIKYTPRLDGSTLIIETEKPVPHETRHFIKEIIGKWVKEIKDVKFREKK